jgi:hypothetical protein
LSVKSKAKVTQFWIRDEPVAILTIAVGLETDFCSDEYAAFFGKMGGICLTYLLKGSHNNAPYFLSSLFSQSFILHSLELPCHPLRAYLNLGKTVLVDQKIILESDPKLDSVSKR